MAELSGVDFPVSFSTWIKWYVMKISYDIDIMCGILIYEI